MTDHNTPRWQSLGHLLREQAAAIGAREFLHFEGRQMTIAEAEDRTGRLANVLAGQGIGKGDRVAVMIPNGLDFPIAWLGIGKLGAVMVPVNTSYRQHDLQYVLSDSGAVFALAGPDQVERLQQARATCPELRGIGVIGGDAPDGTLDIEAALAAVSPRVELDHVGPDDLVNLQYTSGTTGFPKGCMLTHAYWMRLAQIAADYLRLGPDDVDLTCQPFYYMDPQWNTAMCLIAGIPLVILARFSASTFWHSVKDGGVTVFYVLGTMPIYLQKQPENPEVERGHRVRLVLCSGIVPELHKVFEERWGAPWREVFGMTETGADLLMPVDSVESVGSGAMGRPVPGKEARVISPDGRELPDGDHGELVVRGQPMMLGYWNKPEETARTVDAEGWLHTGDVVYRDEQGYFHLVGRLKDMIRRSGENIAAAEVEAVLGQHPAVLAAAVVPLPDELRGEEVKAFIQLRPGETPQSAPPQDIVGFAKEKLAPFKVPRFIEYVDEFPMTPSERIAKHEMMKRRADQRAGSYDAAAGAWID